VDVGDDAEPPRASRGNNKVRHVEWRLMVVEVVQIGSRRRVEGRLVLVESVEGVCAIPSMRKRSSYGVWRRSKRRKGGIYRGAWLARGARV
jgi:hypothetical protein